MCEYKSGVAVFVDETSVRVCVSEKTDSHTKIREEHNIRDDAGPLAARQTPVEYVPCGAFGDWADWWFKFDADRPDWWTDAHTEDAIRQMRAAVLRDVAAWRAGGTYDKDFFLNSLTSPKDLTLPKSVGGYLDLRSLTSPKDLTLPKSVGGSLNLNGLTSPKDLTLPKSVGGDLYICGRYYSSLADAKAALKKGKN